MINENIGRSHVLRKPVMCKNFRVCVESLVGKVESMSSKMKFHIFSYVIFCHEMAHSKLKDVAKCKIGHAKDKEVCF